VEVVGIYLPGRGARLSRPLVECRVSAGFPSPAQDEIAARIDLNGDLVKHPLATFYVRVEGDSMEPRIHPGEMLVVDRMAEAKDGDIVVARLGQEFTVKRLHTEEDGSIWLMSENPS
jgi:DNA polymerase V